MTDNHPITPPPELVRQWLEDSPEDDELAISGYIATQAARWGADMELDACCEWLDEHLAYENNVAGNLRIARRPKPPSLKAGALEVLDDLDGLFDLPSGHYNTLLRALEQLND